MVPFGDLKGLEIELASQRHAAFFVEPIQAEGGIQIPGEDYLREAEQLCRRHGTLMVVDEVTDRNVSYRAFSRFASFWHSA